MKAETVMIETWTASFQGASYCVLTGEDSYPDREQGEWALLLLLFGGWVVATESSGTLVMWTL